MTLKVIKHVKKNFLVFSPIALFWLIIIDIAEGMAPEERVSKRGGRPLLQKDKSIERIKQLLAEREPFYSQADYTLDTTDLSQEETMERILAFLKEWGFKHGDSAC